MLSCKCGVRNAAQDRVRLWAQRCHCALPLCSPSIRKAPGCRKSMRTRCPGPSLGTGRLSFHSLCTRTFSCSPCSHAFWSPSPNFHILSAHADPSDRHVLETCCPNPKLALCVQTAGYTVERVGQGKSGKIGPLPRASGIHM